MKLWRLFLLACFAGAASFGWSSPALSAAEQKAFTQAARELGFDMPQFRKTLAEDQFEGVWMVVSGVRAQSDIILFRIRQLEDSIRQASKSDLENEKEILRQQLNNLHLEVIKSRRILLVLSDVIQLSKRYPCEWRSRGIDAQALYTWANGFVPRTTCQTE